jgi:NAD(P)-dependent dehydrogenase (short-subunit alcohol dehydrogenase family)
MFELKGRTGIITGASSGIGLAMANILGELGATVYAISRTGAPKEPSANIQSNVFHRKGDVCDEKSIKALIQEIAEPAGLDFLINNAGISIKKRAEELTTEEFLQVQQVNVTAPFTMSVLCYPYLKASRHVGRIISISSMAAHLGFSQVVPYCVSKSAIIGLTRALAIEWANDNITVNSIAPGWFPSDLTKKILDENRREKILARMPLHRFGKPEDIGAMAAMLLSDNGTYITGQDYAVDGGTLAYGF